MLTVPTPCRRDGGQALADEASATARVAGAANARMRRGDGGVVADMFDEAGSFRRTLIGTENQIEPAFDGVTGDAQ